MHYDLESFLVKWLHFVQPQQQQPQQLRLISFDFSFYFIQSKVKSKYTMVFTLLGFCIKVTYLNKILKIMFEMSRINGFDLWAQISWYQTYGERWLKWILAPDFSSKNMYFNKETIFKFIEYTELK